MSGSTNRGAPGGVNESGSLVAGAPGRQLDGCAENRRRRPRAGGVSVLHLDRPAQQGHPRRKAATRHGAGDRRGVSSRAATISTRFRARPPAHAGASASGLDVRAAAAARDDRGGKPDLRVLGRWCRCRGAGSGTAWTDGALHRRRPTPGGHAAVGARDHAQANGVERLAGTSPAASRHDGDHGDGDPLHPANGDQQPARRLRQMRAAAGRAQHDGQCRAARPRHDGGRRNRTRPCARPGPHLRTVGPRGDAGPCGDRARPRRAPTSSAGPVCRAASTTTGGSASARRSCCR